ncbi:tyrosine-type recombinase/integrase [Paenibacillus alvei]|nr:tyrosine-type recombinase/integrase [Paenibacillus alvei]MCY7487789.1 tyrosine-type recombinase/integrase [Paenibacillus alvei]
MPQMFDVFIHHLDQLGLADRTIANYRATWSKFQKWMLKSDPGLHDAGQATQKDIADYKRYMLEFGGRGGSPAKPSTMQLTFVQLNAIFEFFAENNFIPDNPVERVKKPPVARRTPKWLSRNEQNAFLREVRKSSSKRDNAIVTLMLRAGLRVHELCDLLLTDLTLNARSGRAYIRGKGYKDREVPLIQKYETLWKVT